MRLLLQSCSTNEEDTFGRYAIVDLDDEWLKRIAARRKLLLAACEQDKELYEMYFWGSSAEFYGTEMNEVEGSEEHFDDALDDKKQWIEITEDFEKDLIQGDKQSACNKCGSLSPWRCGCYEITPDRTDCDQMVITKDGVKWFACDKYSGVTTTTATVPYEQLFKDKL